MQKSKTQNVSRELAGARGYRLAMREAIRSLRPPALDRPQDYFLPIGIYLDTTNDAVVRDAFGFWRAALAEEGFQVVIERELTGSRFLTIIARLPRTTWKKYKRKVERLTDQVEKFADKVEKSAKVICLAGTIFVNVPIPHTTIPPQPSVVVQKDVPAPVASDMWKDIADVQEKSKTAGDAAGAVGAAISLFRDGKGKKKKK
jgi:hypothetical protein